MKRFKFYHWLIIAFVGMIIVGFGIGYVIDRAKNKSIQGTQTQSISPKVSSPKTEVKKDEPKVEESTKEQVNNSTEKSNNDSSVVDEPASTESISQNTPSSEPTIENTPVSIPTQTSFPTPIIFTPTPIPTRTCDAGAKENLLAWYDEKITIENERYEQEVRDIKADFSRRGIWCNSSGMGPQSGLCQVALEDASRRHEHNLNNLVFWLQSELSKINCSL